MPVRGLAFLIVQRPCPFVPVVGSSRTADRLSLGHDRSTCGRYGTDERRCGVRKQRRPSLPPPSLSEFPNRTLLRGRRISVDHSRACGRCNGSQQCWSSLDHLPPHSQRGSRKKEMHSSFMFVKMDQRAPQVRKGDAIFIASKKKRL